MLPYRSVVPLMYVAMLSLCATAITLELYIYVLFMDYGEDQTIVAGVATAIATTLTLVAFLLAAGLWLHKRAPHWVQRLKQHEALRRAEHNLASQNAKAYIRQHME